ncbi:MAG: SusD/RagB family nutrient-binding outer membrane lipoprotein, partial [Bacteroidales bacterium]|nr:SusD/RagB family nutrient-binding outer membrane lipoprotein [Bacteroidales bacterium]
RGWATGGTAKDAFKEGIKQSIKLFFKYQANKSKSDIDKGTDGRGYEGWVINPAEPNDAWIEQFAEDRWNTPVNGQHSYVDELDKIITQKYIAFNILNVREAWNDLRRTGYPSGLNFPTVSDAIVPNVCVRLRYPSGERDFNKNFAEVNRPGINADDFYTKLFWAK